MFENVSRTLLLFCLKHTVTVERICIMFLLLYCLGERITMIGRPCKTNMNKMGLATSLQNQLEFLAKYFQLKSNSFGSETNFAHRF